MVHLQHHCHLFCFMDNLQKVNTVIGVSSHTARLKESEDVFFAIEKAMSILLHHYTNKNLDKVKIFKNHKSNTHVNLTKYCSADHKNVVPRLYEGCIKAFCIVDKLFSTLDRIVQSTREQRSTQAHAISKIFTSALFFFISAFILFFLCFFFLMR